MHAERTLAGGVGRATPGPDRHPKLIMALADAWTSVTGERAEDIALFVHEVPGYQVMENGVLLPEASEDQQW
jgi:hypothetical protein